jgi:hypothetical protein
MSTGYKISEQDAMYFVTFQIVRWIDIFTRKIYRDTNKAQVTLSQNLRQSEKTYITKLGKKVKTKYI